MHCAKIDNSARLQRAKRIPLTHGKFAIVDEEDYEWLSQWKWHVSQDKYTFYVARNTYQGGGRKNPKFKYIRMSRLIMSPPEDMEVDHKNHNGLDNRRCNLRICTKSQNLQNQRRQPRDKTSKYKGVFLRKKLVAKKWAAQIQKNKKSYFLGYFAKEKAAALAYDSKAKELFGEFACINFPSTTKE